MTSTEEQVDPYGFERSEEFDHARYERFMSEYLAVLTSRLIKWQNIETSSAKRSRKLKRYDLLYSATLLETIARSPLV